jgi:hypothetical protein
MARYFSDNDQADHLDDDQADELEYEPFDDVEWTDPDDLDAIDLDVLDDAIPGEESDERPGDEAGSAEDVPATRAPSSRRAARSSRPRPRSRRAPDSAQDSTPETASDADLEPEAETAPLSESTADTAGESADARAPDAEPSSEAEADAVPETAPEAEAKAEDAAADTTAEKIDDTPADEPDDIAEAEAGAETAEVSEPEVPLELVIQPDVYCAVLALPPEIGAGVLELRTTGEVEDMPPPGVILTPHFRAPDIEAVKTVLADWVRIHLPIQLEIIGIKATVVDAQQYVAAWLLEPQEELQESLHTLKRALAELTLPLGGTTTTIGPHVIIGEHVPAHRYVHLIGRMQRDFEPQVWQSAEVQLVRREPDDQPDSDLGTWHVDQVFD